MVRAVPSPSPMELGMGLGIAGDGDGDGDGDGGVAHQLQQRCDESASEKFCCSWTWICPTVTLSCQNKDTVGLGLS